MWELVLGAHQAFAREESLVTLNIEEGMTCDVIGDVHGRCRLFDLAGTELIYAVGQFYDVLHLFSLTGYPTDKHCLLMNGDLVDRGSWSIEVILTAFAFKCKLYDSWFRPRLTNHPGLYPNRMYINRGNHETKEMNRTYGFEGEAKHKHGEQTYKV